MTIERALVGEVLSLERRAVAVEPDQTYEEIGIRSFGRGIFHKEPVVGAEVGTKRVFRIEPGDLVISNVFAWEGAIAVASDTEAGRIGSHRFMTFVATDNRIDTRWASWFFQSDPGLDLIRQASPGSAGRNRTLAIDRFESLRIPLPPIEEQRRVADRLDRLRRASIEISALSKQGSTLAKALAVSLTARPDLDDENKARAGWRNVPLTEILTLNQHEVNVRTGQAYDIAGVYSFGRGMLRRPTIDGSQTSYKTLIELQPNQVVMSRLKAWEGALAVVSARFVGSFVSPEFPTFDINPESADPEFLGALLTSERFWGRLKITSKGIGARRERVNAQRLIEQEIPLPPIAEQRRVVRTLDLVNAYNSAREGALVRMNALPLATLNDAFAPLS